MARINLLPWREELRKEQRRQFFVVLVGSAFLMLLVVGYVHLHIDNMIQHQESRNSFLQTQIKEVEEKIKEIDSLEQQGRQMRARMKVIEQLQGNRSEIVYLFEELAKAAPDGLYIITVKQTERTLAVQGRAQSNARVSSFMRNLDASSRFNNPVLDIIETDSKAGQGMRSFTLRVSTVSAESKE
ncbi:MAG: PilN domain-containing protein [Thiohalomonadaceae bacterium]